MGVLVFLLAAFISTFFLYNFLYKLFNKSTMGRDPFPGKHRDPNNLRRAYWIKKEIRACRPDLSVTSILSGVKANLTDGFEEVIIQEGSGEAKYNNEGWKTY